MRPIRIILHGKRRREINLQDKFLNFIETTRRYENEDEDMVFYRSTLPMLKTYTVEQKFGVQNASNAIDTKFSRTTIHRSFCYNTSGSAVLHHCLHNTPNVRK
ncbi:uncharacterized protein LOC143144384 [Ptiloglossa arizonensis]|uniref:uncharacterized protein LOC143144384 n=1 Tax=Ptiloglossa arizonensis TaxID=3350558 RepID=UPI003F9EF14B